MASYWRFGRVCRSARTADHRVVGAFDLPQDLPLHDVNKLHARSPFRHGTELLNVAIADSADPLHQGYRIDLVSHVPISSAASSPWARREFHAAERWMIQICRVSENRGWPARSGQVLRAMTQPRAIPPLAASPRP